jgi:tetratricopeptide (TPR) repeat protein
MPTQVQDVPDNFIGRITEIDIFTNWLSDPNAPWILYLHDESKERAKKGGVGKTWLLRKFATLAKQQPKNFAIVMVDFFNVADRDGVIVAERVVQGLQEIYPQWSARSFRASLEEYGDAINAGNIDVADIREQLSLALIADLEQLHEQLLETDSHLLVFFDTFELIEQNPVSAVLRVSHTFPDNYRFPRIRAVIAGRNALDWDHPNWRGRKQEVQRVAIEPFNQQELAQYINAQSIETLDASSEQAAALYERTEGRPILVGLVTDVVNRRITTIDNLITIPKADFESHLISKVNDLDDPINWSILFMAHAYHRFNLNLLNSILSYSSLVKSAQEIKHQEWSEELPTLSFVRQAGSGDDFVLHDEMRNLVTRNWWDVQDIDRRYRCDVSRGTVSYYEQEIASVQNEQLRQVYVVEMLYHKLFLDVEDGLKFFDRHFNRAINLWLTAYARSLLQETHHYLRYMSQAQLYNLTLSEAKLLRKEEKPKEAFALYQQLEQEAKPHWLEIHRADLLHEKGHCYLQMSNFAGAIDCFTQSLEIEATRGDETRRAEVLYLLGYIHRREGQLDKAAQYYEDSIAIHKKLGNLRSYANVLNSIAYLYRLQGKMEEALRNCKIALSIRQDLFQQGKTSEVSVGLSLSTMGVIYLNTDDLVSAENAFREALEIFARAGHKKGIASMYIRFGQVEMNRGNLSQAIQWFEKGYYASRAIDMEAQINSLNKQGWVHVLQSVLEESTEARQSKLIESIPFFEQAIELAREVFDYYQEAESLIDLADVLERLNRHGPSQQSLKEAEDIAKRYNYNLLLGIAEEFQGDLRYHAGDYSRAFEHFAASCRYMALYNPIRYNKALRKLLDTLLKTPRSELPAITTALVEYWSEQGLAEKFPELIKTCEEVSGLMV